MTLSATAAVNRYAAAEAQLVFPYTFKVLDDAHLQVFVGTSIVTTGFAVSGVGNDTGGNVTFSAESPPRPTGAAEVVVTLKRVVPLDQVVDLPAQGALSSVSLEESGLDRMTMILQQLSEIDDRTLKVPVNSSLSGEATELAPVASALVGWNASGTGLATYASSVLTPDILPTSFAQTLLDDADADEARDTLAARPRNVAQAEGIAAGAIALSGPGLITVAAEAGTSDTLETVTAWSASNAGDTIKLIAASGHTITVKGNGSGNISLQADVDRVLSETLAMELIYDGSEWRDHALQPYDTKLSALAASSGVVAGGTWLPTISASSAGGISPTFDSQSGGYVRFGNLVVAWFYMDLTTFTGSPSGDLYVADLPVTVANLNESGGGLLSRAQNLNLSTNYSWATLEPMANTSNIRVFEHGDNVASQPLAIGSLTGALQLSGVVLYPVA